MDVLDVANEGDDVRPWSNPDDGALRDAERAGELLLRPAALAQLDGA